MDFVHDQLATGRRLRVLTIVEIFSRFSPALQPRFTFRGTAARRGVLTSFGLSKHIQRLLSAIRTDLDSFTEVEAFALMTSGYRQTQAEISRLPGGRSPLPPRSRGASSVSSHCYYPAKATTT